MIVPQQDDRALERAGARTLPLCQPGQVPAHTAKLVVREGIFFRAPLQRADACANLIQEKT